MNEFQMRQYIAISERKEKLQDDLINLLKEDVSARDKVIAAQDKYVAALEAKVKLMELEVLTLKTLAFPAPFIRR
jgi:hypothetical protein